MNEEYLNNENNEQNETPIPAAAETETAASEPIEAAASEPFEAAPTEPKPTVSFDEFVAAPETAPAVPQYDAASGTYSYSRPTADGKDANGCQWKPEEVKAKKSGSSRGFKVFAGIMLSVFTLSVVTITGFMVFDHFHPASVSTVKKSVAATKSAPVQSAANVVPVPAAFADVEGAMSKSAVATKCTPSVVGIVVDIPYTNSYSSFDPFDFFGDFGFGGFGSYGGYGNGSGRGNNTTQYAQAVGSGFIYSADGYIITNHHVIEDAEKITVYLSDKTTVEAELIGSDAITDLALIKIDATDLTLVPMDIGNSDALVVGDEVLAIGCPAGIEFMGTVTDGIISAINRDVETDDHKTMTLLQTNATINRGNSGGPLINTHGEVIGINTLKLGADYEGIGFSIPINGAMQIISQLMTDGTVSDRDGSFVSSAGQIGIQASDITDDEVEYYGIPHGVLVKLIGKDSSAAAAGLRSGDIITAYNGTAVSSVDELNTLKAKNKAGDEVTLTVYRDSVGKTIEITFKLDPAN